MAIQAETSLAELQESHKRTRDIGSSSGSSGQKRRVWIPHHAYHQATPAPRPSYVAPRLPPPPRQPRVQGGQPNAMAPRPNDGLCFKCGRPGHRARDCRQNQLALLTTGHGNGRGYNQLRNYNASPPAYGRGQANHVDVEEAQDAPTIMMGTLPVNSVPATVLFDSGASHSFISKRFAFMHGISRKEMHSPLIVRTPGSHCHATMVSHNVPVTIGGLVFLGSLITLKSSNIDVILGMDWLVPHKALIDCAAKTVQLTHSSGQTINYSTRTIPECRSPDICSECVECFTS